MRKTLLLLILVGAVLSLSVVRAVISNRISTSGVELSSIERDVNAYQVENMILEEKINKLSSLTYISEKASQSGFTSSKAIFAVSSARPLALKQ